MSGCQPKSCWVKVNWPILKGDVKNVSFDYLTGQNLEVCMTLPSCEIVGLVSPRIQCFSRLRQLNVILLQEDALMTCDTRVSEGGEVKTELHANKFDTLLATIVNVAILYWQ